MSRCTVRAAERSSPCMGTSAGNTGGSRRPVNKRHQTEATDAGCKPHKQILAAGLTPTAEGNAGLTLTHFMVGQRESAVETSPDPVPMAGVRGPLGGVQPRMATERGTR